MRGFGLLLVLVLVGIIVTYSKVRGFLRSEEFQTLLEDVATEEVEAYVKIDPLVWEGWKVRTPKVVVEDTNAVQTIQGTDFEADVKVAAFWSGVYRVADIRLRELEVNADLTKPKGEAPPVKEKPPKKFWRDWLPDEVDLSVIEIAKIKGEILTEYGPSSFQNLSAAITPGQRNAMFDLHLQGGEIKLPFTNLSEVDLLELKGRYADEVLYLLETKVDLLEGARVTAQGQYHLENDDWNLSGNISKVQCAEVLSKSWKQRLAGELNSDFQVEDGSLLGTLELERGVLTAFPILDRIADYTEKDRFRHLVLSEASLDYRKEGEILDLSNITLASEGLVRIEGRIVIKGELIQSGDFRVGITPGTLARIPGAETKVFIRGDKGLLWAPMKVSGTLSEPKEDLTGRLIAAAGARMLEALPESGQALLKQGKGVAGEALKAGADLAQEATDQAVGKAVEVGADAVKKGTDTIFNILGSPLKKKE